MYLSCQSLIGIVLLIRSQLWLHCTLLFIPHFASISMEKKFHQKSMNVSKGQRKAPQCSLLVFSQDVHWKEKACYWLEKYSMWSKPKSDQNHTVWRLTKFGLKTENESQREVKMQSYLTYMAPRQKLSVMFCSSKIEVFFFFIQMGSFSFAILEQLFKKVGVVNTQCIKCSPFP